MKSVKPKKRAKENEPYTVKINPGPAMITTRALICDVVAPVVKQLQERLDSQGEMLNRLDQRQQALEVFTRQKIERLAELTDTAQGAASEHLLALAHRIEQVDNSAAVAFASCDRRLFEMPRCPCQRITRFLRNLWNFTPKAK